MNDSRSMHGARRGSTPRASASQSEDSQVGRVALRIGIFLLPWMALILIWALLPYTGLVKPALVPSPLAVGSKFLRSMNEDSLWLDIITSTRCA